MRKLFIMVCMSVMFITGFAHAGWFDTITNEKFFQIRSEMRNANDYKRRTICEGLMGSSVDMKGKIQTIDKYGTMMVDLDTDSFASFPDVQLDLKDKDQVADLKSTQIIYFTGGDVTSCEYIKLSGTLIIHVDGARLQKHY